MNLKQCYAILEIDETAGFAEIKQAYRDLIAIWHPDRHTRNPRLHAKATEKLKELNTAFDTLTTHRLASQKQAAGKTRTAQTDAGHLMMKCPSCGASNRVKLLQLKLDPKCGKCGLPLLGGSSKKASGAGFAGTGTGKGFQGSKGRSTAEPPGGTAAKPKRRVPFIRILIVLAVGLSLLKIFSELPDDNLFGRIDALLDTGRQTPVAGNTHGPAGAFHSDRIGKERIADLQKSLLVLGYDSGPVDGKMGVRTITATQNFAADFRVDAAKNSLENIVAQAARQASIARSHPDWPDIAYAHDFNVWIENQTISSPEICRKIRRSGTPEQVADMVHRYKFDRINPQPVALPASGIMKKRFYKGMAPLKIKTRDEGRHYYIKLVTIPGQKKMFTAFIRSGGMLTVHVPLGTYELKYAVGLEWYGNQWLFGNDTVFSRLEQEFKFELHQNEISGYSIDLYLKPVVLSGAKKKYAFDF